MMQCNWVPENARAFTPHPGRLWTLLLEYVPPKSRLKIEASGTWRYGSAELTCDADGDANPLLSAAACPIPEAPVGALIGKIGGSTIGRADGLLFASGVSCVLETGDAKGPLYLAINVPPGTVPSNAGTLQVTVSEGRW